MKTYLKFIIFYCFSLIEAFINLLCAILGYYPKLDFSVAFLTAIELRRVFSELITNQDDKVEKLDEADSMIKEAKSAVFKINDE